MITNVRKNSINKKENQAQSGRSMVEMLGVLAIVGVLSIGGIAGYRTAMDKYVANQIANEINIIRTDIKMKIARGMKQLFPDSPYSEGHLNFNKNYGVEIDFPVAITDATEGTEETGYAIILSKVPTGVCKQLTSLLDGMNDTVDIKIGGNSYYDATERFCNEDENTVDVTFSDENINNTAGAEEPEEPTCDPSTCEGNCINDTCEPCSGNTPKWNGTQCVACLSNSDCPAGETCTDQNDCKAGESGPACTSGYNDNHSRANVFFSNLALSDDGKSATVTCNLSSRGATLSWTITVSGWEEEITLEELKNDDWSQIKEYCGQVTQNSMLSCGNGASSCSEDGICTCVGNMTDTDYSGTYSEEPFAHYGECTKPS